MNFKNYILLLFCTHFFCAFGQSLKPESSFALSDTLKESSGLIFWNNKLWTHNDDGDTNLYGLDKNSGEILQTIPLKGVVNNDWESISQDENYIYIGDFGNNVSGNRTDLNILKIEKKALLEGFQKIDTINFKYSNQSNFSKLTANTTDFDGEAFVVTNDSIIIFTKQWKSKNSGVYYLSKNPGNHIANLKATLQVKGLITDATFCNEKKQIILCGYSKKIMPFLAVLSLKEKNESWNRIIKKIKLKLPFHQVEGISSHENKLYITNEAFSRKPIINIKQKIHVLQQKCGNDF